MSVIALRLIIFVLIGAAIFFGLRRIWRDWRGEAKALDAADRQRDLRERNRPDVITLKRDADGKYRPPDDDETTRS